MNFIKKIWEGKSDHSVHIQFQKFSRGEFKDRAVIKVKVSGEKYTINTSAEFANEMVEEAARKMGKSKSKVEGAIVYTGNLDGIEYKGKKQFQGVKRYLIENEMTGDEILAMMKKFPKAFYGISFESDNIKLKVKAKAPKSGKPGTKGDDQPKADFCKLITEDKELGRSFVFEAKDFKEAEIKHVFVIEKIEIPEEVKKSNDFARMREEALRVGKIIRIAKIDGKETRTEMPLRA